MRLLLGKIHIKNYFLKLFLYHFLKFDDWVYQWKNFILERFVYLRNHLKNLLIFLHMARKNSNSGALFLVFENHQDNNYYFVQLFKNMQNLFFENNFLTEIMLMIEKKKYNYFPLNQNFYTYFEIQQKSFHYLK